jgi:hypothetical protein
MYSLSLSLSLQIRIEYCKHKYEKIFNYMAPKQGNHSVRRHKAEMVISTTVVVLLPAPTW